LGRTSAKARTSPPARQARIYNTKRRAAIANQKAGGRLGIPQLGHLPDRQGEPVTARMSYRAPAEFIPVGIGPPASGSGRKAWSTDCPITPVSRNWSCRT
jgi:hypothetical protein